MEMPIERVYAHPLVCADRARVALQRDPLIYCLEGVDNGSDLDALFIPRDAYLTADFVPDLLGGITVIRSTFQKLQASGWEQKLYHFTPPLLAPTEIQAIPYCLWDNRGQGEMRVWLHEA